MNFHRTKKLLQIVSHDLSARKTWENANFTWQMVWPCPLNRFMPLSSISFGNFGTRTYFSDSRSRPHLPASKQMLMRFCTHLVDRLHHSSIKVYLSAVRSLHIDYGFSDPLPNCLQLQHLLRGIKLHQGSNLTQHQLVTVDLMSVLHRSLDLANLDNIILWAACCVGFFGFLRGGEFTVNSPFDPSLHLTLDDIQVDAPLNHKSVCLFIKCFKTDPLRKGCFVLLGHGSTPLSPVVSLVNYPHLHGLSPGPLFLYHDSTPLSRSKLSAFLKSTLQ